MLIYASNNRKRDNVKIIRIALDLHCKSVALDLHCKSKAILIIFTLSRFLLLLA